MCWLYMQLSRFASCSYVYQIPQKKALQFTVNYSYKGYLQIFVIISYEDIFLSEIDLLNLVIEKGGKKPQLNGELHKIEEVYEKLAALATSVDVSLSQHVAALRMKTVKQLQSLEKKMLRAERKKHDAARNKIERF